MLNVTVDWITGIAAIMGVLISLLLGLPALNKFLKAKKYKNTKELLENKTRQIEVQPNFEIVPSEIKAIIKFRNIGLKATKFIFTVANIENIALIPDRNEAETFEVVSLYLGDKFNQRENPFLQIHFGYADVDNRRYQQTFTRKQNLENITSPELLISRLHTR